MNLQERLRQLNLGSMVTYPSLALGWARIQKLVTISEAFPYVAGICGSGATIWNPELAAALPDDQLNGVQYHELLHLLLSHEERGVGAEKRLANIAMDMVINHALQKMNIALPSWVYYPPKEYTGPMRFEEIYCYLEKHPPTMMPINIGAGCGIDDSPNAPGLSEVQRAQLRETVKEIARSQPGQGSDALVHLLSPRDTLVSWKDVIRSGFESASGCGEPTFQTYSRRHRRSPAEGVQFPGWISSNPSIGIIVDVSGSMGKEAIDQIVAEIKVLLLTYPAVTAYLVVHTDRVVWEGEITSSTADTLLPEAINFSGGTDPTPAYEALRTSRAYVDTVVHFTDCEFFGSWPEIPASQLIVGAFGSGARTPMVQPPEDTTIIPCSLTI